MNRVRGVVVGALVLLGTLPGCSRRTAPRSEVDPAAITRMRADSIAAARDAAVARETTARDSVLHAEDARSRGMTAYARGAFLAEERRAAEALPYLEEAASLVPDLAEAHYNLALVRFDLGDSARAIESFRRSVEIAPHDITFRRGLAAALAKTGRVGEAVTEYERVLQLDPQSAETHFALARLREQMGDREGALGDWRRFLDASPTGPWADEARRRIEALSEHFQEPR